MNDDLISRKALLEAFGEEPFVWDDRDREQVQERNDWKFYVDLVKSAPSIDVEELAAVFDVVKEVLVFTQQNVVPALLEVAANYTKADGEAEQFNACARKCCTDDADLEHMTRFAMQQAINRK